MNSRADTVENTVVKLSSLLQGGCYVINHVTEPVAPRTGERLIISFRATRSKSYLNALVFGNSFKVILTRNLFLPFHISSLFIYFFSKGVYALELIFHFYYVEILLGNYSALAFALKDRMLRPLSTVSNEVYWRSQCIL